MLFRKVVVLKFELYICAKEANMRQTQLYTKLNCLPAELKSEVNDFIDFLLSKRKMEIKKRTPKFGCAKGQIYLSPDFDAPLDDFKDYM